MPEVPCNILEPDKYLHFQSHYQSVLNKTGEVVVSQTMLLCVACSGLPHRMFYITLASFTGLPHFLFLVCIQYNTHSGNIKNRRLECGSSLRSISPCSSKTCIIWKALKCQTLGAAVHVIVLVCWLESITVSCLSHDCHAHSVLLLPMQSSLSYVS